MFAQHWIICSYLIGVVLAWLLSVPGQFGKHFVRMLDTPPPCGIAGKYLVLLAGLFSWMVVSLYLIMWFKVLRTAYNTGSYRAALRYLFTPEEGKP